MHARPQVREILIAKKMQGWCLIAQHPFVDPQLPACQGKEELCPLVCQAEMVLDRTASVCGSQLPDVACKEELCPLVCPVPRNYAETRPTSILRLLGDRGPGHGVQGVGSIQ